MGLSLTRCFAPWWRRRVRKFRWALKVKVANLGVKMSDRHLGTASISTSQSSPQPPSSYSISSASLIPSYISISRYNNHYQVGCVNLCHFSSDFQIKGTNAYMHMLLFFAFHCLRKFTSLPSDYCA